MPPELTAKIYADVSKVLDLPETRDFFEANSLTRVNLPPQQFGELIQSDLKHWTAIINAVGVKIE
jgi:tripartite-type tricarboxylate transporter receptor subunit TctC